MKQQQLQLQLENSDFRWVAASSYALAISSPLRNSDSTHPNCWRQLYKTCHHSYVKTEVDNGIAWLSWKNAVKAATTANITLSSPATTTIDGYTLVAGDRVLVKDQTIPAENGIYIVAASWLWSRSTDADIPSEIEQSAVYIKNGTINKSQGWVNWNIWAAIVIWTTPITYSQFSWNWAYTAWAGINITGNTIALASMNISQFTNNSAYITNNNSNYLVTGSNGNGLCFWADCTTYKISMGNAAEYMYGPVTSFSIKNTMSNTAGRGWTWWTPWATPVAAIDTAGTMQIAGQMTATQFNGTLNWNATTATTATNSTQLWWVAASSYALLASPALTWDPTAPTPLTADNDTSIATTAFVKNQAYLTSYTETDPKVGANTLNYVPKWNGSALANSLIYSTSTGVWISTENPSATLAVSGSVIADVLYLGTAGSTLPVGWDTSYTWWIMGNNISNTNTGNVGIGTSTPSAKLEVAGDAKLSGLTVGRWWGNVVSNTANGLWALSGNTSGGFNTAIWNSALLTNTTGDYNTANGFGALSSNTTGYNNVANGYFALSLNREGHSNTAIWTSALYANSWGVANTAVWNGSLYTNTTGYYNTAIWNNSLLANTTGVGNTANGAGSLRFNTTGNYNTANGFTALINSTTGFNNTANGYFALYYNTTGYYNTAIWANTLTNNTTGTGNTAIWNNVLTANTTGSNNSALGNYANITLGSLSNVTLIGANTVGSQSNTVILGSWANVGIGTSTPWAPLDVKNGEIRVSTSTSTSAYLRMTHTGPTGNGHIDTMGAWALYLNWFGGTAVNVGNGASGFGTINAAAFTNASDRSYKKDIKILENPLTRLLSLEWVSFKWKNNGRPDIGFIAQDIEKIIPEIVSTNSDGKKSVEYGNISALIVEAVKEQQKIIDAQNEKIDELQKEILNIKISLKK